MVKISLRFCKLQILQAKLLAVQFFILLVPVPTYGYVCNVPNEWFRGLNNTRAHTANGALWPNVVVKYTLHSSLSNRDRVTIWKAFTEFHEKTCIRFQPRQNEDPDFTEILTDDDVCGLAEVCKIGGYQFTKFGKNCRTVETMIHELGHTLCLYHEQQRKDRDEYLSFQGCPQQEILPIEEDGQDTSTLGLYDYASQMHYQCGFCDGGWPRSPAVTKCGDDATTGLSLLDADNLNRIYNCQGCFRHRWKKMEQLTSQDRKNVHSFGYKNSFGYLYPCRALVNAEIAVGKYSRSRRVCSVSNQGKLYELKHGAEVLTIPGGRTQRGATYKLVRSGSVSPHYLVANAVNAGRLNEAEGGAQTFIAYATLRKGFWYKEDVIGKVATFEGELENAKFSAEEGELVSENYFVLICT